MRTYRYSFTFSHNNEAVNVVVDYDFVDVSDLETISNFPHRQRRTMARYILDNLSSDEFHNQATITTRNPFVHALVQLFNGQFCFYWTQRHSDTLIFITGQAFLIKISFSSKISLTRLECVILIHCVISWHENFS